MRPYRLIFYFFKCYLDRVQYQEYFDQQSAWRKFKQDFCRLLAPIL